MKKLRFDFSVWVFDLLSVLIGFDFLLGLELGEVIEGLSPDHGLVGVEFELIVLGNGVDELLDSVDCEFLDLVAVEEE
jgi:hypothetical protein